MAITIEIFLKFGIKGSQCEVNKLFRILHFQIDIYLHQLKMIQSSIYLYLNDSPSLQIQTNQKNQQYLSTIYVSAFSSLILYCLIYILIKMLTQMQLE